MKVSSINEKIIYTFLLFTLFFPVKFIYAYYSVTLFLILFFFFFNSKYSKKSFVLMVMGGFISLIFINSVISSIYLNSDFFRNFTEVFRFLPLFIIVLLYEKIEIEFKIIIMIVGFYTIVNLTVNILQFAHFSAINFVGDIYSSDIQVEKSLGVANRALGLSSGPGSNGAISVVLSIIFLVNYFYGKEYRKYSIFLYFSSFLSVLLSQSQTGFVAISFISFLILTDFILKNINKKKIYRIFPFLISFILALFYLLAIYWDKLKYLLTLFEMGTNRSSYEARENKVSYIFDIINQNQFFLWIGHGKDYIPFATGMDNEYVFSLAIYGILGSMFLLIMMFYMIFFSYLGKDIYSKILFFYILVGFVIAWPSSFLTDTRIALILFLFLALSQKSRSNLQV